MSKINIDAWTREFNNSHAPMSDKLRRFAKECVRAALDEAYNKTMICSSANHARRLINSIHPASLLSCTVGGVPFDEIRVGDKVISCTGKPGVVGAKFPRGFKDPFGNDHSDDGGGILFLWQDDERTFSIAGHRGLEIIYNEEK